MDFDRLRQKYVKKFKKIGVDVITASELSSYEGQQAPVVIQDIGELRQGAVAFEIEQLRPNVGASSDLLRYNILWLYGGAYFDSDVGPNPAQSLAESGLFGAVAEHRLYLDHKTQQPGASKAELQHFNFDTLGNDTFICSQGNPVMQQLFEQAQAGYRCAEESAQIRQAVAHFSREMSNITIGRTGPDLVRRVLYQCQPARDGENIQLSTASESVLLCRVRDGLEGGLSLTLPLENTQNWLKINVMNCEDLPQRAFELTLKAIDFELNNSGVLRLDDHILYLSKSLAKPAGEVAPELLRRLRDIPALKVKHFCATNL